MTARIEPHPALGRANQKAQPRSFGEGVRTLFRGRPTYVHDSDFVLDEAVLPDPYGDQYLGHLGVFVAGPREMVMVPRMMPGLLEHYEHVGIIRPDQVVQVPHSAEHGHLDDPHGYPAGSNLARHDHLVASGDMDRVRGRNVVLMPTLINDTVREQAARLGMRVLDIPHSSVTNNKLLLREHAAQYGINMLPGDIVRGEVDGEQMQRAIAKYSDKTRYPHGVWVKLPGGSGGDTVLHIADVSTESLQAAIVEMRQRFVTAAEAGARIDANTEWPEGQVAPTGAGIIIESDANNEGEVLALGSAHAIYSARRRQPKVLGYFRQITQNGSFVGSSRFYPDDDPELRRHGAQNLQRLIDDQIRATGRYNAREHGHFGIQGPDYVVIKRRDTGKIEVVTLELNTRPIISTYADYAANKLQVPHWINTNVTLGSTVTSFDDFSRQIGEGMIYDPQRREGVLLLASRTVVGERPEETKPSPHCKILVLASTPERTLELLSNLQQKGIQLGTV